MLIGYQAIKEELERLKANGVDYIFLNDDTRAQIAETAANSQSEPIRPSAPVQRESLDIKGAVASHSTPERRQPAQAAKAKPDFLPTDYVPIPKEAPKLELPDGSPAEQMDWLRERVLNCKVCQEHLNANGKIVFGTGAVDADILFCGEAPGADEEIQGEPFVGKAGDLLTKIIQAMGLKRESVYIANILNWRPEHDKPYGNRPPTIEEMNFCLPYLKAQIEIVRPKVIVALGNTAVSGLLGPDPKRRMGAIRGTWNEFNAIPTMITFHPSYLLRNDTMKTKRMVWEDMLKVMEKAELPISEKQQGYFLSK